jgi:hypothetical protein
MNIKPIFLKAPSFSWCGTVVPIIWAYYYSKVIALVPCTALTVAYSLCQTLIMPDGMFDVSKNAMEQKSTLPFFLLLLIIQ